MKLAETQTTEAIAQSLKVVYSDDDIAQAFEALTEFQAQGLLFNCGQSPITLFPKESNLPHLLLVLQGFNADTFSVIENTTAGTNIALAYTIQALKNHAMLHFAGTQNRKLSENLYEVDLNLRDILRVPEKVAEQYSGILTLHWERNEESVLPLFRCPELPPILMQIHAVRGHGGTGVRSVLLHYAALRDCDAFTAPSDSVGDFYSQFVWDKSVFHTVPNGIDLNLFRPMDKQRANQELAELVGDERIKTMHTVGYLSRLQAEKGIDLPQISRTQSAHPLFTSRLE